MLTVKAYNGLVYSRMAIACEGPASRADLRCFVYVAPVRDREECWKVWRYEQPEDIVRDPHARYEGLGIINHDSVTLNTLDDVFTLLEIWRVDTTRFREAWKLTEQLNKVAGE